MEKEQNLIVKKKCKKLVLQDKLVAFEKAYNQELNLKDFLLLQVPIFHHLINK